MTANDVVKVEDDTVVEEIQSDSASDPVFISFPIRSPFKSFYTHFRSDPIHVSNRKVRKLRGTNPLHHFLLSLY